MSIAEKIKRVVRVEIGSVTGVTTVYPWNMHTVCCALFCFVCFTRSWQIHERIYSYPIQLLQYHWGNRSVPWWRHQMETFSALLAICAGNSPVPGEFPTQRPVTRSFDVFFDLRLNKRLSKQSWGWWFETLSRPLWRQCNAITPMVLKQLYGIWIRKSMDLSSVSEVNLNDIGKIDPYLTTTKHKKSRTLCLIIGMYSKMNGAIINTFKRHFYNT